MIEKYIYNEKLLKRVKDNLEKYKKFESFVYKWNEKINITSYNRKVFFFHAILEPLLIFNKLDLPKNFLDIGTGFGNPSVSIAITFPEIKIYCSEINPKRVSFLNFVKMELNLKNLEIIENYNLNYEIVTARAFKSFNNFLIFLKEQNIKYEKILFYFRNKIPFIEKIIDKIEYFPPNSKTKYFQVIYAQLMELK